METLRIGMLFFPTLGGSGYMASRLTLALADQGHEIHVYSYRLPLVLQSHENSNVIFHQVPLVSYPLFREIGTPYALLSANAIFHSLQQLGSLDLLHAHYAIPHAIASYLAGTSLDLPMITTLHGSDVHTLGKKEEYRLALGSVLEAQTELTAVSHYLAREAVETFQLSRTPAVIYNFVDPLLFSPEQQANLDRDLEDLESKASFLVVHASNFRAIKNLPLLLRSFSRFLQYLEQKGESLKGVQLWLVGEGPMIEECRQLSKELQIQNHVFFLGIRHNLAPILARADVVALPSRNESFGLVLAEAMACETPVIATRVGGIPEVVDDSSGWLVSPDVEDLTRALISAFYTTERKEMGKHARSVVLRKFSPSRIVSLYLDVYKQALQEHEEKGN